jgi:hypothetical protein
MLHAAQGKQKLRTRAGDSAARAQIIRQALPAQTSSW